VAKYTSPHLVDFRERFLIDGVPVESGRIIDFVDRWTPDVERLGATFFEATTAMAFDFFAEAGVDAAVIETGLGGRLDATNVVTPLVAGVTNIGIDHVEYLGATREKIAFEKAGIFKPGVPAVIGEPDPEIRDVLYRHAAHRGATPIHAVYDGDPPREVSVSREGTSFTTSEGRLRTPLLGAHQAANAAVAAAMLRDLPADLRPSAEDLARGLLAVRLPGRFQRVGKRVFDVAHNPDAARVLAATLAAVNPPRPIAAVLGVLADKDWRGVMETLAPSVDLFVLTSPPTAPPSRAWSLPDPSAHAREHGWNAEMHRDFDRSLERADEEGATVLVTGSFHTVGDAMARLGIAPLEG